jgi:hypothetical protein
LAASPPNKDSARLVRDVLAQVGTPPVKPASEAGDVAFDSLPPFDPSVLRRYADEGDKDSPLRKAVRAARAVMWAVSTEGEPPGLREEVHEERRRLKVDMSVLRDGFAAPPPGRENQLKTAVLDNEKQVALILGRLKEALEELEAARPMRGEETKRWQANYDYVFARLQEQTAFVYEYQSALGRMRKELPPRDPKLHGRWILAATTRLQGDSAGKKLARDAGKLLDRLVKENAGTPWEILAKRERLTALGLDWQAAR